MKVKGRGAISWPDFGGAGGRGDVAEGGRSSPVGSVWRLASMAVLFSPVFAGGVVFAVVVGGVRRR